MLSCLIWSLSCLVKEVLSLHVPTKEGLDGVLDQVFFIGIKTLVGQTQVQGRKDSQTSFHELEGIKETS